MAAAPHTIAGRVLNAQGEPVAGVRVLIVSAPGAVPDTALLTDEQGRFTLAAPQAGRYEIAAHGDALGSAHAAAVTTSNAGASVVLQLGPG
jgi:protocatechuate 3,4-dioxygenase beta subunit